MSFGNENNNHCDNLYTIVYDIYVVLSISESIC